MIVGRASQPLPALLTTKNQGVGGWGKGGGGGVPGAPQVQYCHHVLELNHCCRLSPRGYCLCLYGCSLCPVLLRLQRQQRDQCRAGHASRPPAESRRGGEGGRHHSDPLQKVPTEETEERQLGPRAEQVVVVVLRLWIRRE